MHELGIVSGILETVTAAAREAGASRVVAVTLRIGDLREVVPESLDFAWEVLTEEDPVTCGCELEVEEIILRADAWLAARSSITIASMSVARHAAAATPTCCAVVSSIWDFHGG